MYLIKRKHLDSDISLMHNKVIESLFALVICCITLYRFGDKVGIFYGDEFGYYSVAGTLCGFNWSDQLSHMAYYNIGYGLLLIPSFIICKNVTQLMMYATGLNIVLLVLSYYFCLTVLKKLFPQKSLLQLCLCAFMVTMYIGNISNIQMGWTEVFNVFLYWLSTYLILMLFETKDRKHFIFAALVLCYCVITHMRNITYAASGLIAIIYFLYKEKKVKLSNIISFAITIIIGIAIFFISKNYFKSLVYLNSINSGVNDISYVTSGLLNKIISPNFVNTLYNSIMCKTFYIISVTGFIICFGILFIVKEIKHEKIMKKKCLFIYSLSVFLLSFLLCSCQMLHGGRGDVDFYARYYEPTIGMILIMGIFELSTINYKELIIKSISILAIYEYTFIISEKVFENSLADTQIKGWVSLCAVGISKYMWKDNYNIMVISTFKKTLLIGLLFFILINLFNKQKEIFKCIVIVLMITSVWVIDARYEINKNIETVQNRYNQIESIVDYINCDWNKNNEKKIYYYTSDYWDEYLLSIQASIGKTPIKNIDNISFIYNDCDNYVLLDKRDSSYSLKQCELESKGFQFAEENNMFILYTNLVQNK